MKSTPTDERENTPARNRVQDPKPRDGHPGAPVREPSKQPPRRDPPTREPPRGDPRPRPDNVGDPTPEVKDPPAPNEPPHEPGVIV